MKYQKAKIENGQINIVESKEIDQNSLTSDCWSIQFGGLIACESCEYNNTPDCSGGETLKRLKRQNG